MTDVLSELRWRGLLQDATPGLDVHLREPRTAYCGFDPTAPSLQLGNLVPLMLLRHLQRHGHTPIALMGGGTGLIGDPAGKRTERPLLPREQIRAHVDRQRTQMQRFLDFAPGRATARLLDNAAWLEPLPLVSFLRDIGKHFTVNVMLQKESVQSRLDAGLSYTEFSYMLLQAYDFLQLYRQERCTIQVGGADQWGNITAGVDLIRRVEGGEAHALVAPLVTTSSGVKFGKSDTGAIYLDPDLTSPYRFYQFWINSDDRDVETYLKYFTERSADDITAVLETQRRDPAGRTAQRALADSVCTLVHGPAAAARVAAAAWVLFGDFDPKDADPAVFDVLAEEVPTTIADADRLALVDALVQTGLAASKADARRTVTQGGAYVNQRRVSDTGHTLSPDDWLGGSSILLRKGKKDYALLRRRQRK